MFKKIHFWVNDYFGFSPKETKGFLGMITLMCILLIIPPTYNYLNPIEETSTADKKQLDSLIAVLDKNLIATNTTNTYPKKSYKLFRFNPNTLDLKGYLSLGFEDKIASRIVNYRTKGGKFFIKSDLSKIYGLDKELYATLLPYIDLPDTKENFYKKDSSYAKNYKAFKPFPPKIHKTKSIFDINKADTTQLIALKGIGTKLALRIITFRDKLGGFINKDQYKEVYGLDSLIIKDLGTQTKIEGFYVPVKLNVNTASFEELKNHPYIKYKIAKLIIAYREQHGQYKSLEEIKKIKSISEKEILKILPYLTL